MKSMKFSEDYLKLQQNTFHTIRRMPWWAKNDIVIVKHPSGEFQAKIICWELKTFSQFTDNFVIRDTWIFKKKQPNIYEAKAFIEKLLKIKLNGNTIFIEYWLTKINKELKE